MSAAPSATTSAPKGDGRSDALALGLLREHLAEHLGSAADTAEIVPLFGDASTRRYFRVRLAATHSAVAALYPEPFDAEKMPFLEVQRLLEAYGLPVPR